MGFIGWKCTVFDPSIGYPLSIITLAVMDFGMLDFGLLESSQLLCYVFKMCLCQLYF